MESLTLPYTRPPTAAAGTDRGASEGVQRALEAMRRHLGLEVAFVSQIRDGRRVFLYVDFDLASECPIAPGGSDPVEESYCHYVINGQIPELLVDPAQHPVASALPATRELPVGTHVSVPIQFADGSVFGTFCCFSLDVKEGLDERDIAAVRMLSRVVAGYLEEQEARREDEARRRDRLRGITAGADLTMVFQPIVRLTTGDIVGYEALARFSDFEGGPGQVFAEAQSLGVGAELEMKAIRSALEDLPRLPDAAYLSVNAAPTTLASPAFLEAVSSDRFDPTRLVVEVTEHAAVDDYDELLAAVAGLAGLGVRLAIDDVGMGFSGLNHIVRLAPHIIKIDAALVRDVDTSVAKQALTSALVTFAARLGVTVIAEGVETSAERNALRVLGAEHGQGYHLGHPRSLTDS